MVRRRHPSHGGDHVSSKKSSKKATPKPAQKPAVNVISLDALLGNWPTIELGGIRFEGRHVNQTEKLAWLDAELAEDPVAQRAWLVQALNARGAEVDDEWVAQWPDVFLLALVTGLYGNGWPGEEGAEGK